MALHPSIRPPIGVALVADEVIVIGGGPAGLATGACLERRGLAARFPGQGDFGGQVLHASEYHNPSSVRGRRVLVVGLGNSGAEIATELADAGRQVAIAVRSGVHLVPRDLLGAVPIQYVAYLARLLPPRIAEPVTAAVAKMGQRRLGAVGIPADTGPLTTIPVIGLGLVRAIKAGKVEVLGALDRFAP